LYLYYIYLYSSQLTISSNLPDSVLAAQSNVASSPANPTNASHPTNRSNLASPSYSAATVLSSTSSLSLDPLLATSDGELRSSRTPVESIDLRAQALPASDTTAQSKLTEVEKENQLETSDDYLKV
jgi:hypothetical protein